MTDQFTPDLNAPDPIIPAGAEETAPEAPETPQTNEPPKDVVSSVAARLEQNEAKQSVQEGTHEATPVPFDISRLSKEQIQTLKSMLAATPETQTRKKENPRVRLRSIGGKIVIDHKNAYMALVRDPANHREVERHKIPVQFYGEEGYSDMLYSDFINSEQVFCEVLSTRREVDEVVEGVTTSRETGLPTEMVVKYVRDYFTVKLPNGDTVEIMGKVANA